MACCLKNHITCSSSSGLRTGRPRPGRGLHLCQGLEYSLTIGVDRIRKVAGGHVRRRLACTGKIDSMIAAQRRRTSSTLSIAIFADGAIRERVHPACRGRRPEKRTAGNVPSYFESYERAFPLIRPFWSRRRPSRRLPARTSYLGCFNISVRITSGGTAP
jgi:hypothetical protein